MEDLSETYLEEDAFIYITENIYPTSYSQAKKRLIRNVWALACCFLCVFVGSLTIKNLCSNVQNVASGTATVALWYSRSISLIKKLSCRSCWTNFQ